jgi:hypothetical protein
VTVPISVDQLADVIRREVFEATVTGCEAVLTNPPGRAPDASSVAMSQWYTQLADEDRAQVRNVLTMAADSAVFGMLCLLDNVRPIVDGFRQELRLSIEAGGKRYDFDPTDPLHDAFRSAVSARDQAE